MIYPYHTTIKNSVSQRENTETLCNSVVKVAEENGGHVVEEAKQVVQLFTKTFTLFSLCHMKYNSKLIKQEEITELGE